MGRSAAERRTLASRQTRLADPDPWRNHLREILQASSTQDRLTSLKALTKSARFEGSPAMSLNLLGATLLDMGDPASAAGVLRAGQRLYPGDVWLNISLALCLERLARREEAIRYYVAARALRPETAHSLAHALEMKGEPDEAIAIFRDLARLRPKDGGHLTCLSAVLLHQGRSQEVEAVLEASIAASHETLHLKPDDFKAPHDLGYALEMQGKLEAAAAEDRTAIRVKPNDFSMHSNLGILLHRQAKFGDAVAAFREAVRLNPDSAEMHNNLGAGLLAHGKFLEGIAALRPAIKLKPDAAFAYFGLGNALQNQGNLEEAIAAYRKGLGFKPDEASARRDLAKALRAHGEFPAAIAELRRTRELAGTNPGLALEIDRDLAATEQQAALAPRLPAILAGTIEPSDAVEARGFARLCVERKLPGASVRLWDEAFRLDPKLAEDMQAGHRYNAARAAALAGCGQGKDDPPLDETAKARWRKQPLNWLKADLAAWSKVLEKGPPQVRQSISQTVQHWKTDSDLAGLRDEAALAKLPEDEQKACRALWAEVDALLK